MGLPELALSHLSLVYTDVMSRGTLADHACIASLAVKCRLSAAANTQPLDRSLGRLFPLIWTPTKPPRHLTHTHTHLTALCLGLPGCAGTRKVKPNLDFTEARDSEWQWHQLGHMQVCSRQITTPAPHHSVFYRPDALPATQPTVSKHWRQVSAPRHLTQKQINAPFSIYFVSFQQFGKKGKGRPYSITERRVPELIPVLRSQPAGDVSHNSAAIWTRALLRLSPAR